MKLTITYDESIDAWEIQHQATVINSDEAFAEWRRQVLGLFEPMGEKVYLLINIDEVEIYPAFADKYAATVMQLSDHVHAAFRYGTVDDWTSMTVEMQGAIHNYGADIFPNREAAIEAMAQKRAQTGKD